MSAANADARANESRKVLQRIKVTLLATRNGYAPAIAIQFGPPANGASASRPM